MKRIQGVHKLTDNPYLNLYQLRATSRDGDEFPYYVASRRQDTADLKAVNKDNRADGVILYGVYGEKWDKVVLIRQYRYPAGDYVYEFPAGLVEPGEDTREAGIREMKEETGLAFTPIDGGVCSRPFFTTAGLTDESCAMLFGYCAGTPNNEGQEDTEDITVILADREECRRILAQEKVALMCAYMLMHFISSPGEPFRFLEKASAQ